RSAGARGGCWHQGIPGRARTSRRAWRSPKRTCGCHRATARRRAATIVVDRMNEQALEIQALLRSLVEQQTALLSAHAAAVRLQSILVERLLSPATSQSQTIGPALQVATARSADNGEPARAP